MHFQKVLFAHCHALGNNLNVDVSLLDFAIDGDTDGVEMQLDNLTAKIGNQLPAGEKVDSQRCSNRHQDQCRKAAQQRRHQSKSHCLSPPPENQAPSTAVLSAESVAAIMRFSGRW